MVTKAELRDALYQELEWHGVDDADEIADTIVEKLDEDGVFELDEDDE